MTQSPAENDKHENNTLNIFLMLLEFYIIYFYHTTYRMENSFKPSYKSKKSTKKNRLKMIKEKFSTFRWKLM